MSGEFGRIDRYFKPLAAGFPGARGLADDAAVFSIPDGQELVVTTDAMVAGIHFLPDDPPDDIAAKLLRVNLSDLAAMGARPYAYTLMTSLPRSLGEDWLAAFAAGLAADGRDFAIALSGGDSVSTSGPITLCVTAFGLVQAGTALPRSGGRPGDDLYVTGTIGDAALGLGLVLGRFELADNAISSVLIGRLRRPDPRVSVGCQLGGLANACLDVSDGLIADLGHLAHESGCAAVIDAVRLPFSAAASVVIATSSQRFEEAITGGDDYELVFSAPAGAALQLSEIARQTGVAITRIGQLTAGQAGHVTLLDSVGAAMTLSRRGWDHF